MRAMKKGEKMMTTNEVMERLDAPHPTVLAWIKRGLFPGAKQEETPRGPVWVVPLSDVENFRRPAMGRPPKPDSELKQKRRVRPRKGQ